MRPHLSRWLFCIAVAAPITVISTADAQPEQRDHRRHPPGVGVQVGISAEPTEAPPPAREEKHDAAKAGFVWLDGQWDWKDGKWDWVAGHWEREQAGKHWRHGKWEQKDGHWKHDAGGWDDGAATATTPVAPTPEPMPPPPANAGEPTAAPPPPREEKHDAAKAGFVWVEGAWDWKDNKWDWVAGHWEREQAGKHWRPMRWEQHEGHWKRDEGGWDDQNAATPPGPPGPPGPGDRGMGDHHRHDWKLDRPVVSSYWPTKGKIGSRIVIRGKNFPTDAQVLFAGNPVTGAKVTADKIVFEVPANAVNGTIALKAGGRRDLPVGSYEVAATFDAAAEQKRIEDEQRKAAEAAWNARQSALAKDRAAREAAIKQRQEDRQRTREDRRAKREAEIQAKWDAAFLADGETQNELTLHAQRVAEITRMRDIADVSANAKLAVRIEVAQQREDQRHQQRMDALHAGFQPGGTP
jgi:hypothetical protein